MLYNGIRVPMEWRPVIVPNLGMLLGCPTEAMKTGSGGTSCPTLTSQTGKTWV